MIALQTIRLSKNMRSGRSVYPLDDPDILISNLGRMLQLEQMPLLKFMHEIRQSSLSLMMQISKSPDLGMESSDSMFILYL